MPDKDPSAHQPPRASTGVLLFLTGGAGLFLTAPAGAPWVSVFSAEPWAFQAFLAAGGTSVVGALWSIWAATRPPPPKPKLTADQAFRQKTNKRQFDPVADAEAWMPNPGVVRPATDPEAFKDLTTDEMLDIQIQELKEKVARAKVMFGTGKLSKGGYASYVKELKDELARLENLRLGMESPEEETSPPRSNAWDEWEAEIK